MAVAPVPARSAAVVEEEEEKKKRVRVTGTCTVLCDERVCSFLFFFTRGEQCEALGGRGGGGECQMQLPPICKDSFSAM